MVALHDLSNGMGRIALPILSAVRPHGRHTGLSANLVPLYVLARLGRVCVITRIADSSRQRGAPFSSARPDRRAGGRRDAGCNEPLEISDNGNNNVARTPESPEWKNACVCVCVRCTFVRRRYGDDPAARSGRERERGGRIPGMAALSITLT